MSDQRFVPSSPEQWACLNPNGSQYCICGSPECNHVDPPNRHVQLGYMTPVHKIKVERFSGDCWRVVVDGLVQCGFYTGHPDAEGAARAEADRLRAELNGEQ